MSWVSMLFGFNADYNLSLLSSVYTEDLSRHCTVVSTTVPIYIDTLRLGILMVYSRGIPHSDNNARKSSSLCNLKKKENCSLKIDKTPPCLYRCKRNADGNACLCIVYVKRVY